MARPTRSAPAHRSPSLAAEATRYPVPGPAGGKLIRQAIALLRRHGVKLPITSDILIATSGGSDSVAGARLLVRYGRRIVAPERIALLHVNHGWRGAESDADARFVEGLAESWGVPCITRSLERVPGLPGASLEERARRARKAIYFELARTRSALVVTAHHADDLAETVLWRLLTGSAATHGGGIAVRHGIELRPLLGARKAELRCFLTEEGLPWREDRTNHEGRFLRSRMRMELMPAIEALFPRGVEHLARQALRAQARSACQAADRGHLTVAREGEAVAREGEASGGEEIGPLALLGALGANPRRAHFEALAQRMLENADWEGQIHLPDGWKVMRERSPRKRASGTGKGGRWILEQV